MPTLTSLQLLDGRRVAHQFAQAVQARVLASPYVARYPPPGVEAVQGLRALEAREGLLLQGHVEEAPKRAAHLDDSGVRQPLVLLLLGLDDLLGEHDVAEALGPLQDGQHRRALGDQVVPDLGEPVVPVVTALVAILRVDGHLVIEQLVERADVDGAVAAEHLGVASSIHFSCGSCSHGIEEAPAEETRLAFRRHCSSAPLRPAAARRRLLLLGAQRRGLQLQGGDTAQHFAQVRLLLQVLLDLGDSRIQHAM